MPRLLSVTGLRRRYGTREVLRIDALDIDRGSVLALVGPSGAGKSTLLRLLCGLETPDAGTIAFETPGAARTRVAMCFQRPALLDRSVRDNVRVALAFHGRRDDARVDALLDQLGLRSLKRANVHTLSAGEAQRVALARALALDPELLLLDEPTASLDPANIALIERVVADEQRRTGASVVWVTHNLGQARRITETARGRVALLLDGALVAMASTAAFFDAPADARVAAFVRGDMVW